MYGFMSQFIYYRRPKESTIVAQFRISAAWDIFNPNVRSVLAKPGLKDYERLIAWS